MEGVGKHTREVVMIYHFRYMREYRAIAVLWGLLSIIWCILNLVAFVQPQWIGDSPESPGYGHMGLYQYCYPDSLRATYVCSGTFTDFSSILNDSFRACTFFVGVSALLMLIVVAALLLFFCFKKTAVFIFSGILQLISAVFMFLGCVIYPNGWNHQEITILCGTGAKEYKMGECGIRWAYILAILGIFDAAVLAMLAFFLASKRAKLEIQSHSGTVSKSELNGGYSDISYKQSLPIQPQMVSVPGLPADERDIDRYSEFSHHSMKARSNRGFQL